MLHCFSVGSCLKAGVTGPAGDFLHVVLDTGAFNILLPVPASYSACNLCACQKPKARPVLRCMSACVPVLQSAGKGVRAGLIKCGQCKTCLKPQMKKPCLNPIMQPDEGLDGSEGSCSK